MFAVLRAAMNMAVPAKIATNPCDTVVLPRARKVRPLPWTDEREAAFRAALAKRESAASADRDLTVAERQALWADKALRPSPVMVWMPKHTGQFLDFIETERLFALFALVAYSGLRRDEAVGLAGSGSGPKSDSGERVVPLPEPVVSALKAWRVRQSADRLAWGRDWPDNGLVFTREDGTPVPGQWVSVRFETLACRAGLPPVRFHDLRHGAASLAKAAGLDSKYIYRRPARSRAQLVYR
jgi:integrase